MATEQKTEEEVREAVPPEDMAVLKKAFPDCITIEEALVKGKGKVSLRGWVYRIRSSNKFVFLVLRDSTDIIQCVVKAETQPELHGQVKNLLIESSIMLSGELHEDTRAPTGYELRVDNLKIVQAALPFPIAKDHSPEFLLDQRHLWLRSRKLTAVMRIRHTVHRALHEFFTERGYTEFSPPIFTPNACEGGNTLFNVKYFSEKDVVYLTQSWQLYAEAAIFSLGKIYCMSPTFRAERSKTNRHLAEFWMHEMEAPWMDLDECAQVAKDEIKYIIQQVLEKNQKELKILERDVEKLRPTAEKDIPTITYTEALKILKEKDKMDVQWGKDLRTLEEEGITRHFDTPVVVTEYPKEIMAFYKPEKKGKNDAPGPVALCFDMLAPEGYCEIFGGSQRDLDIKELRKALKNEGADPSTYEWYFDTRRFGSVPHSGYGMGVERVINWICDLRNIKDAIPFPRTMLRKTP